MDLDFMLKAEISSILDRTRLLLDSKILWDRNPNLFFRQSVYIEILVHMKDLLIKSEKYLGKRISFQDDVLQDEQLKIKDVTDLICNFRDAACHNDSFRRKMGTSTLSFNTIWGKGGLMMIDGVSIGSNYDDEVGFNMGKHILYLKRHIERAFYDLDNNFRPLVAWP